VEYYNQTEQSLYADISGSPTIVCRMCTSVFTIVDSVSRTNARNIYCHNFCCKFVITASYLKICVETTKKSLLNANEICVFICLCEAIGHVKQSLRSGKFMPNVYVLTTMCLGEQGPTWVRVISEIYFADRMPMSIENFWRA